MTQPASRALFAHATPYRDTRAVAQQYRLGWLTGLLARRPAKVADIALANKMARVHLGASYEKRCVQPEASHGGAARSLT